MGAYTYGYMGMGGGGPEAPSLRPRRGRLLRRGPAAAEARVPAAPPALRPGPRRARPGARRGVMMMMMMVFI